MITKPQADEIAKQVLLHLKGLPADGPDAEKQELVSSVVFELLSQGQEFTSEETYQHLVHRVYGSPLPAAVREANVRVLRALVEFAERVQEAKSK